MNCTRKLTILLNTYTRVFPKITALPTKSFQYYLTTKVYLTILDDLQNSGGNFRSARCAILKYVASSLSILYLKCRIIQVLLISQSSSLLSKIMALARRLRSDADTENCTPILCAERRWSARNARILEGSHFVYVIETDPHLLRSRNTSFASIHSNYIIHAYLSVHGTLDKENTVRKKCQT